MTEAEQATGTEPAKPTTAGVYDVYLGGSHHTQLERETADKLRELMPDVESMAWANRSFHQRVARWLAEQGVRQFVDLGAGLPTQDNTHQVVQRVSSDARVVYVDIDPRTVSAGQRLVADSPHVAVIEADLRDPEDVLARPELRGFIDLTQPTALLCTAMLHFVSDDADPWGMMKTYVDAMSSGSYLAVTHITADKQAARPVQAISSIYRGADQMIYFRNREQVDWFFTGMDLVPPYEGADAKLTFMGIWGCEDPVVADDDIGRWAYAGVARKP